MDTLTHDQETEQVIGWTVTDNDGNVIDSGSISIAEMTFESLEEFQINQSEEVN